MAQEVQKEYTQEYLEKIAGVQSAEELIRVSKEAGYEVDADKAAELYDKISDLRSRAESGDLTDEELAAIAGGRGWSERDTRAVITGSVLGPIGALLMGWLAHTDQI